MCLQRDAFPFTCQFSSWTATAAVWPLMLLLLFLLRLPTLLSCCAFHTHDFSEVMPPPRAVCQRGPAAPTHPHAPHEGSEVLVDEVNPNGLLPMLVVY